MYVCVCVAAVECILVLASLPQRLLGMQTHTAQLIALEASDSEVARLLMLKVRALESVSHDALRSLAYSTSSLLSSQSCHACLPAKAVGNTNLNSVLEARLQSGPMAALRYKPTATSSLEEKRAFVGKKYDLREYMIRPDRQVRVCACMRVCAY